VSLPERVPLNVTASFPFHRFAMIPSLVEAMRTRGLDRCVGGAVATRSLRGLELVSLASDAAGFQRIDIAELLRVEGLARIVRGWPSAKLMRPAVLIAATAATLVLSAVLLVGWYSTARNLAETRRLLGIADTQLEQREAKIRDQQEWILWLETGLPPSAPESRGGGIGSSSPKE
jgi:hypothetical protein